MTALFKLWVSMVAALVLLSYGTPNGQQMTSPIPSPLPAPSGYEMKRIFVERRYNISAVSRGLNERAAYRRGFVFMWR